MEAFRIQDARNIINCKFCGKQIVFLYRTGKPYPVDVKFNTSTGVLETAKDWFHQCSKNRRG